MVFQALCDDQAPNYFTSSDVSAIYQKLIRTRTPAGYPGPNDRPFWCMGQGEAPPGDPQYPGRGLENSWLRSVDGTAEGRLFNVPQGTDHPYLRNQLLTKIYNSITTRSNIFAVFLTVGFFEVADDTQLPVTLGNEIGKAEGRHIRHRMFAIVDRTTDATADQGIGFHDTISKSGVAVQGSGRTAMIRIVPTSDIKVGVQVEVFQTTLVTPPPRPIRNPSTGKIGYVQEPPYTVKINDEMVTVLAADPPDNPTQMTAVFRQPHKVGSTVRVFTHGVSIPRYNAVYPIDRRWSPADSPRVVPFFRVIE